MSQLLEARTDVKDGDGTDEQESFGIKQSRSSDYSRTDGDGDDIVDDNSDNGNRNNGRRSRNGDGGHDGGSNGDSSSGFQGSQPQNNFEQPPPEYYPPPPDITSTPITTIRNNPPPPPIVIIESSTVTSIQMTTTTTVIPIMTTTPLAEISSQPRKGVDPPPFTSPSLALASTSTIALAATITASSENDTQYDDDDDGHKTRKDKKKDSGELDETAEHLLIAAGAIGAFILFCFISWIVYRTMKKSRGDRDYDGDGLLDKIIGRRRRRDSRWDNRSVYSTKDMPPPSYTSEKGGRNSMENAGYYGQEKKGFQPASGGLVRSNTVNSQRSQINTTTLAPGSVVMIPAEQYLAMSQNQGTLGSDVGMTMRSMMPDSYYNQSELSRQPSNAYDPTQRQVYRASELSSISSGFGDMDIIVSPISDDEPPQINKLSKPEPAAAPLRQSNNFVGRFSWMARKAGERETVYTVTSEDRPARYRSVSSWVNQQTGRVKRADERQQGEGDAVESGEAPPLPTVPTQTNEQIQTDR